MSLIGKRAQIAAALSGAPGVRGYDFRPAAATTGDAWPRWGGLSADETAGEWESTWQVLVQLPGDDRAADAWVDQHLDGLGEALQDVGYITGVEPVDIGQDGRPRVHGLMITMRSE